MQHNSFALYDDGKGHCFHASCEKPDWTARELGNTEQKKEKRMKVSETLDPNSFIQGHYADLVARKISQPVCEFFGYQLGYYKTPLTPADTKGDLCHVANWFNDAG